MKHRGFVTIATGDLRYYKMAYNLLCSYRWFSKKKVPFAIICDKENQFTQMFDKVVIMDEPTHSFMDKLALFDYTPYEETIFIDADSTAYGDLNNWWAVFEKGDDFSCIGYMWQDIHSGRGWFKPEGLKEFSKEITYIPDFNGGMYYLRKTSLCKRVFEQANFFARHYEEYSFNGFRKAADEPCLALAMAVNNCHPIDLKEGGMVFAPSKKNTDLDIDVPRAYYRRTESDAYQVILVHWSNYYTTLSRYKFEMSKLYKTIKHEKQGILYVFFYTYKVGYVILKMFDLCAYAGRVKRKLRK